MDWFLSDGEVPIGVGPVTQGDLDPLRIDRGGPGPEVDHLLMAVSFRERVGRHQFDRTRLRPIPG